MLTRFTVLITSQYIQIPNRYVVHLELICYMSVTPQFLKYCLNPCTNTFYPHFVSGIQYLQEQGPSCPSLLHYTSSKPGYFFAKSLPAKEENFLLAD